MGDEGASETSRQLSRQPRIIIRKCKKPSKEPVSKSKVDSKKINGELLTESKNKNENKEFKSKEPKEQGVKSVNQVRKRKVADNSSDEDCLIIEPDSTSPDNKQDGDSEGKEESLSVEFKGFKKRIIAETEKLKDDSSEPTINCSPNETSVQEPVKVLAKAKPAKGKGKKKNEPKGKKSNAADGEESQTESQAEYAQYLGLQPTMQFKCYRCGEKGFPSMLALNMHQRGCGLSQKSNFIANLQQDTTHMSSSDPNMLTNFRITRKVYLCSACGTYYENWNLFLHMRDVHKKHICLYCLTMFTVANKLADHLQVAHSAQENSCKTIEEFQNTYIGSCYLICCSCENMYTERDDFHNHECVKKDPTAKCPLCGVKCGHYYTCPNSNLPLSSPVPVNVSPSSTTTKSQVSNTNKTVTKNKTPDDRWLNKKNQGGLSSDNDDDYDISNAASFCHVDIADESGEKNKIAPEDNIIDITDDEPSVEISQPSESTPEIPPENSPARTEFKESNADNISTPETCKDKEEECTKSLEPEEDAEKKSDEEKEAEEHISAGNHENKITSEENEPENNHSDSLVIDKESTNTNLNENCGVELSNEEEKEINENTDTVKTTDKEDTKPSSEEVFEQDDKEKNNESTKVDGDKSQPSSHLEKTDTATSDSDRDEVPTHQSISQDDTGSSSSDSSSDDEDTSKSNEQSAVKEKDISDCESEDSDKSGLIVDEINKPPNNDNTTETENKTLDNPSEDETLMETKSVTSNEATKDFLLDDTSSLEKPVEINPVENESDVIQKDEEDISQSQEISDGIPVASEDVPAMALTLEDKLEVVSPQAVVKECVRTSCLNCVYCSHAVKIAVNGKQLALHLLAEHRYKPIKNNETGQDVIQKLKSSLDDLENVFFNTEFYDSSEKPLNTIYDHTYECFQCSFVTKAHKELYNHKKKMHQKAILLCVMCKANFFSYSELLCHMCPGIYVSENVNFRCCFCNLDMIPSAFRLMVHMRKSHHTCDICLEMAGDQQKLSTHMWKHKLNHMCYRCGISYRNKPDITKHLFWKHGTESVLCKKCLQKKWPHVYHFCIPPTVFICEECNASFTKAVALKVHKRYHGGELPYGCSKCEVKFVSKKLLSKHEETHNKPLRNENVVNEVCNESKLDKSTEEHINVESIDEPAGKNASEECLPNVITNENEENSESQTLKSRKKKKKDRDRKGKPVVDVYDLPPLNLSSESDSSDEETKTAHTETSESVKEMQPFQESEVESKSSDEKNQKQLTSSSENIEAPDENQPPVPIVDGVWDNFHSYKAELEKRESKDLSLPNILPSTSSSDPKEEITKTPEPKTDWSLLDHSYCLIPGKTKPIGTDDKPSISEPAPIEVQNEKPSDEIPAPRGHSSSIDHAYATTTNTNADSTSITNAAPKELSLEEHPSTPPSQVAAPSEPHSSPKKKLKTPKKKKRNENSSSSSDSSSDSDSSSRTCGPDCSCSNTSSSSSSSSSDSESSTSEGRQRATDKREKKKERIKHKHHKEDAEQVSEVIPAPPIEEEPVVDVPEEPIELPVRESDLDTDESSTDEDFYDKCPQTHGKQEIENRKQEIENRKTLLFLESVAPVNNGTVSPPPPPPVEENPPPPPSSAKRKVKTKRRRKSQQSKKQSSKFNAQPNQTQPSTINLPMATSTPSHVSNHQKITSKVSIPLRTSVASFHSDVTAGSGSENESARLSKRKRVRNKFYGYSSDEEEEKQNLKWRKTDTISAPPQVQSPGLSFQQSYLQQRPQTPILQVKKIKTSESSGTEEDQVAKPEVSSSSSSSSESENEIEPKDIIPKAQTEKNDNLYCYCQCPYDEVSEMIACDGQDCTIEWFHFECVGIMVPPKGKWYCPDCRKRRGLM